MKITLPARITMRLFHHLVLRQGGAIDRAPDYIVGSTDPEGPYLMRWYVTRWRGWFAQVQPDALRWWQRAILAVTKRLPNLYVHRFLRSDDDRALHDHPSAAVSLLLAGQYTEHTIANGGIHRRQVFRAGDLRYLPLRHTHRIEVGQGSEVWTLFLFFPRVRDWGFHCPQRGWVPWREFTADGKPGEIGPGCGE